MSPPSPQEMVEAVTRSMKERTGRTVEEWVELVRASGVDPLDRKAVRSWLKQEHALPQNSRYAVAHVAARGAGWEPPTLEEEIRRQYAGPKAALGPIFERVRRSLESLGDDVRVEARRTYIPFIRRRQLAAVVAATRTRVDVGLRFEDPPDSPLLKTKSVPGQGTHKISLRAEEEVTPEVEALFRAAYEQNG